MPAPGNSGISRRRMPRDVPGSNSSAPFLASARKWSSAELAVRKPKPLAISARVGGIPVISRCRRIQSRICRWRTVSGSGDTAAVMTGDRRKQAVAKRNTRNRIKRR
jgi:hypothetical protein